MSRRKRSILMSVMTMMLCLTLVAGGTYALFTDEASLSTHLEAGKLDITLKRTYLESMVLNDSTGFLDEVTDNRIIDFSNTSPENVFGITDETLIVPCTSFTATMQIENHSDVAFGYWVEVKLDTKASDLTSDILARQLIIRIDLGGGVYYEQKLSDGLTVGEGTYIDVLAIGETDEFKVTMTFIDDSSVNNSAMNKNVDFDIVVHAVQVVSES